MKNESKLEIGDVVQLKSGGPKMTVIAITDDFEEYKPELAYFTANIEYNTCRVTPGALIKIESV